MLLKKNTQTEVGQQTYSDDLENIKSQLIHLWRKETQEMEKTMETQKVV